MPHTDNSADLVVAIFGNRGILETAEGEQHRFLLKGRRLRVVCGDLVESTSRPTDDDWLVTGIRPRHNLLERPDNRGNATPLAANLDILLIVLAPRPQPDFFVIDRFLCAAEFMRCDAALVVNKTDLGAIDQTEIQSYRQMGYTALETSVKNSSNIAELENYLGSKTGIFVGQSGVGKSSLINALKPNAEVVTGQLTTNQEGRHTTTASIMHTLADGGRIIDAPGVRDFVPQLDSVTDPQLGFREIIAAAANCKFNNCRHLQEPSCGVRQALEQGNIHPRRYESYKRLLRLGADQKR
jgi:ribosome biogenesis GTPase